MRRTAHRTELMLAVSAGLALGAVACGGGAANPAASAKGSAGSGNVLSGNGNAGNGNAGNGTGSQGNEAASSWTPAFARCMRAHGVPNFPDPNGQAGQLGPGSGIYPNSPQFQAALNGPCLSLAPAGWVSSGKVTR